MENLSSRAIGSLMGNSITSESEKCQIYLLLSLETRLGTGLQGCFYLSALAYCFIGLSAITARFFRSMENVVKHMRTIKEVDPTNGTIILRQEKVWNYTIADITLLAFGTSFPQISLATIDAIRNIGKLYAGGLGPGTLVGSAAFDLFPIHAVCVVVPKAGELKKISDIGVWLVELFWSFWAYVWLYIALEVWTPNVITLWEASLTVLQFGLLLIHVYAQDKRWPYLSLPLARTERPEDWVPVEENPYSDAYSEISEDGHGNERGDSIYVNTDQAYQHLPSGDTAESSDQSLEDNDAQKDSLLSIWKHQFIDAFVQLESPESRKLNSVYLRVAKAIWGLFLAPWRILFALVPPYQLAHGWIAFISSLIFISGIAYVVTKLTDLISCVTGINPYIISFTALAAGTSWPDLVASKIAAERQITADSAIANITCRFWNYSSCHLLQPFLLVSDLILYTRVPFLFLFCFGSNSVNIYIGIGVPWLIDTMYNFIVYKEPLRIANADGLSFSLLIFFATSVGCIGVLVFRRLVLGAELGGPRIWAWITSVYFMLLWLVFVVLSSLRISGFI